MDYKQYLTQDVLPFWLDNAIDDENGGIFTCLDRAGQIYGTEKCVWFQGRALWTFAKAYNYIEKNPKYLYAAKKLYDFLPLCEGEGGRMFFTVTKEGTLIQKRRYYYSETFAAIGCAQYFKATGLPEAWANAERYFSIAKRCFDDPSLNPPKYNLTMKSLAPVMIMMSTARAMAECAPDPAPYEALAAAYLQEVLHGGYIHPEIPALLEHVSADGTFCDTPTGRTVNPGHSLETAWFVMTEGLLQKNDEALATAKQIIDFTLPFGWDKKHGGIIAFCDALGKPPVALEWDMKLWWPQNEAIIATAMAYEVFGDESYRELSESFCDYAFDKFADREYGEWFGYLHYDSTPANYLKGNIFKGPFHLPRMLMLMDKIQQKDMMGYFK